MTLGQRIQELRKQKELSQEALGEKLGVSRQAVSRWEMDGAVPEVDKLIAMAKLFGVSLNQLLDVEESGQESPHREQSRSSKRFPLLGILCVLLSAALVISLGFNLYYRHRVLMILDPPQPPDHPVESVEYAFQPDYETMTYDLALILTENGELRGYDAQVAVVTYLSEQMNEQREEVPVTFRDGAAEVLLEDLPFGYHRGIGISLVYTKGELQGQQYLMRMEPTGRGISWMIEDGRVYGSLPTQLEETPELLTP